MDRLSELLDQYDIDPESPDYSALTDEQLAELHQALLDAFAAERETDAPDLAVLRSITDAAEALRSEDGERQTAAAEAAAEIAALEQRLAVASDDDADDSVDDDEDDDEDEDLEEVEDEVELEPVAAAAQPRRVPLADLNRRRTARHTPLPAEPEPSGPRLVITAAADIPGVTAGAQLSDLDAVASALHERVRSVDGGQINPGQKFYVARMRTELPERNQLGDDPVVNARRVKAVVDEARNAWRDGLSWGEALTAAGGLCAPLPASYAQETVGTDDRPIKEALPTFDAGRGGVRFMQGPTIGDIDTVGSDAATGVWTMDDDENALTGSPTKPIQRITCGTETSVEVYAVTDRLRVGNVLARTFPERVRAFIDLTEVAHARLAENRFGNRLRTLSTEPAEETQVLGSYRDLLAAWTKAAWSVRNRNRMARSEVLQVLVPDVVVEHAQTDLSRQIPGDGRESLRTTQDQIVADLRTRGLIPIFSPDLTAMMAPAQGANPSQLTDLISPVHWGMWPLGTFVVLDGGRFDLGFSAGTPIRDTDRNAVNDYELFAEEWEEIAKFGGVQSLWVRSYVCPTGETAGTVDVTCDTAS